MTDTDSFLIEVHPRNQSRMNNVWSFTSMNHVVRKEIIWYYYGATSVKKLKTQKYDCIEENSMKITNCYDEFYMQSMNCSFPWLKINNQSKYVQHIMRYKNKVDNSIKFLKILLTYFLNLGTRRFSQKRRRKIQNNFPTLDFLACKIKKTRQVKIFSYSFILFLYIPSKQQKLHQE